jgi:hypothetical protein
MVKVTWTGLPEDLGAVGAPLSIFMICGIRVPAGLAGNIGTLPT